MYSTRVPFYCKYSSSHPNSIRLHLKAEQLAYYNMFRSDPCWMEQSTRIYITGSNVNMNFHTSIRAQYSIQGKEGLQNDRPTTKYQTK